METSNQLATPSVLKSMAKMKCPNCREGDMFENKSVFPLNKMMEMPKQCASCGQLMEIEPGFYYGTGYVSYALSLALITTFFVAYWVLIGISLYDNSLWSALGTAIAIVFLLQPWIMRYSRVLYLYMFVKYKHGKRWK